MKKGDLSKLIEVAVRWRVFEHTLDETRAPPPIFSDNVFCSV
jgi:hypothetical protein